MKKIVLIGCFFALLTGAAFTIHRFNPVTVQNEQAARQFDDQGNHRYLAAAIADHESDNIELGQTLVITNTLHQITDGEMLFVETAYTIGNVQRVAWGFYYLEAGTLVGDHLSFADINPEPVQVVKLE
jgi:hypothetical protein